ncbi:MAG: hypothetical protein KAS38_09565 [Anaerolineales bacterium]|nr:hypothetical protein [Anaerolineales bacterium]
MSELLTIKKWNYGKANSRTANTIAIDVGKITFFFSYDTIVAFLEPGVGLTLSVNRWGPTTGRHLNWISETRLRTSREEFDLKLGALLSKMNLALASE